MLFSIATSSLLPSLPYSTAAVQIQPTAVGARNFSQCDSMLIGDGAAANTYPYIQVTLPSPDPF